MKQGYIYGIKNKKTQKVIYVGCTTNLSNRKGTHFYLRKDKAKQQPIQVFINENGGTSNFELVVLESKIIKSISELYELEAFYISKFDTYNFGLNARRSAFHSPGGDKNPNSRKVFCETTGEIFNTAKAAAEKYNFDYSDFSAHLTGRKYLKGIGGRKYGRPLSFKYIGREKDTRTIDTQTKSKMSKRRVLDNQKKVRDNSDGVVYDSLKTFCKEKGYTYSSVSSHLAGSRKLKKYDFIDIDFL
ncbi:GIY-YIG nuclease family protein [Streptococcus suis]|nr:GIY-YIG nuclease family protein [Streptococcus suis]